MNKEYPTLDKTIFLVCEDFRVEPGGKVSLLGVFGGGDIVIEEKVEEDSVLPSLAVFMSFTDGVGKYQGKLNVLDPNDSPLLPDEKEREFEKKSEGHMNLLFKLVPFRLSLGTYKVNVMLDDKHYQKTFVIKQQNK